MGQLDNAIGNLSGLNRTFNSTSSFLLSAPVTSQNNIGALFNNRRGGDIVNDPVNITNRNVSVAALIRNSLANGIKYVNMLIIDEPIIYRSADNSTNNKSVASSIVVASTVPDTNDANNMNISLFFQVLPGYEPSVEPIYYCSFFDTVKSGWNESGCTAPIYNNAFQRYECSCNHLTSFALVWSPKIPQPEYLTAQDITSLVCLSISIATFVALIIHSLVTRFPKPRDLLPLTSFASTTLLFIFFIAMTMTVYTRTPIPAAVHMPCFTSASVLMFFVYFFLIFMFCVKTSVSFFNYLRFIHLFPEPSMSKLSVFLIISFFMAIAWTSFAAGFNSNSSFHITQLHGNKICWFTQDVIYYFVTIPVGIFIVLNFLIVALVIIHIISHARNATSPHQSYEWMKRGVLVLLFSCVTQGIGWLFGPFISFVNPSASNVLGWFFVVFNGLEGLWALLLYIVIRFYSRYEQRNRLTRTALF